MYNYPIKKSQVHAHEECSRSEMNSFWQIHQQLMIKRFHPECVSALKTRRIRYTTRKAGQNMFAIQVHNVHIHLCIGMGTSIHASGTCTVYMYVQTCIHVAIPCNRIQHSDRLASAEEPFHKLQ